MDPHTLVSSCRKVISNIDSVVCSSTASEQDKPSQDPTDRIPTEFFKRNEEEFRGLVSIDFPAVKKLYQEIELAKPFIDSKPLKTIYFGGGTPSTYPADLLLDTFGILQEWKYISQ